MNYNELPKESKGIALITIVNFYIKLTHKINDNPQIINEIDTNNKIMPEELQKAVKKYKNNPFIVNKIYKEYKDFFISQLEGVKFLPNGDVLG